MGSYININLYKLLFLHNFLEHVSLGGEAVLFWPFLPLDYVCLH